MGGGNLCISLYTGRRGEHCLRRFYMRYYTQPGYLLCALLLSLSIVACNGDIFVEDIGPLEKEVTVEGDGGSHTIQIRSKGLRQVSIGGFHNDMGCTYYNKAGEEIPYDSPVADVARINYTNRYQIFDVLLDGDNMTFHSTENALGWQDWHLSIGLDYEYMTEWIDVKILRGKPMEYADIHYDMEQLKSNSVADPRVRTLHYMNAGDFPTRVEIRPYQAAQAYVELIPEESWAKAIHGEIVPVVPTMIDGRWVLATPGWNTPLDQKWYYKPEAIDRQYSVWVDLEPNSKADVKCSLTCATAEVPFVLTMRNPVSGREDWTLGTCRVVEPVSYEISVDYVE